MHGTRTWGGRPVGTRPSSSEGPATRGGIVVKKLLLITVAAVAGLATWRKLEADKAEQALWAEVTDPVA